MEKLKIYVYIIGGFTDNLKIYNIKETEISKFFNITFVIDDRYKSPTRSSNRDIVENYSFPDIILRDQVPMNIKEANFQPKIISEVKPNYLYCYNSKEYGKSMLFISKHIMNPSMKIKLLNPSKEISQYSLNLMEILKKDKWILVGNRCSYLSRALHGKDKLERLLLIGEYLSKHPQIQNILLCLDDSSFLIPFRYIFGDILKGRKIIYLKLNNNDEHEYIQIATYCTPLRKLHLDGIRKKFNNFIHDHSGFYTLLEEYIGENL